MADFNVSLNSNEHSDSSFEMNNNNNNTIFSNMASIASSIKTNLAHRY